MASEPSKVETDVRKFSLQCLAETRPRNICCQKYFVDEDGRLLVIGYVTSMIYAGHVGYMTSKLSIHVHDKVKNEWTKVEQKGTEWPICCSHYWPIGHSAPLGSWSTCQSRYRDNTIVLWMQGADEHCSFIQEIWLFNMKTLIFKKVAIASHQNPQGKKFNSKFLLCVVGLKLMLKYPTPKHCDKCWSLDLEEVELYGKGYWKKMNNISEEDWNCNSAAVDKHLLWCNWNGGAISKIDFKKRTCEQVKVNPLNPLKRSCDIRVNGVVEKALLAVERDIHHKLHILGADASGHEGKTSLTLTPLVPGDRASRYSF